MSEVPGGQPWAASARSLNSLLLKGVQLPHVSILLGHASIKITERHYAPWVKARQEQLEAEVKKMWATVP